MNSVLFVGTDRRMNPAIEAVRGSGRINVHVEQDVDAGMKRIFDGGISLVFICSTVGDLSGAALAGHARTLLQGGAPRLVLMRQEQDGDGAKTDQCDAVIDLEQPDLQVANAVALEILPFLGNGGRKKRHAKGKPAAAPDDEIGTEEEGCAAAPELQDGESQDGQPPAPDGSEPGAVAAAPTNTGRAGRFTNFIVGVVVGCAGTIAAQYGTGTAPAAPLKSATVAQTAAPVTRQAPPQLTPPKPRQLHLCRAFTALAADPVYAIEHPGWERWRGNGIEVLAYSEGELLRAVQVLQSDSGSFTREQVAAAVGEMSGSSSWQPGEEKQQKGLVTETGLLEHGTVTIYRKNDVGIVAYSVTCS